MIQAISQMREEKFETFVNIIKDKAIEKDLVNIENLPELEKALYQIRKTPEIVKYQMLQSGDALPPLPSLTAPCTFMYVILPFCFILLLVIVTLPLWLPIYFLATALLGCY